MKNHKANSNELLKIKLEAHDVAGKSCKVGFVALFAENKRVFQRATEFEWNYIAAQILAKKQGHCVVQYAEQNAHQRQPKYKYRTRLPMYLKYNHCLLQMLLASSKSK